MERLNGRRMTFAPVLVREGVGLVREVRNVQEASDTMLAWPGRSKAWRRAADVISEALYGRATPQVARRAFLAAAKEAGLLIERED